MAVIRDNFQMDPFSNAVFLFCGRKKNTMKALYFDRDGFVLLQKRLDNGKFQWPRNASEVRPLTRQEFRWLMEGLSIDQPKAIQPANPQMWDHGARCPGIVVHDIIMMCITLRKIPETG